MHPRRPKDPDRQAEDPFHDPVCLQIDRELGAKVQPVPPGKPPLQHELKEPGEGRDLTTLSWSIIPHWAKELAKYSTNNDRFETIKEKIA